MTAQDWLPGLEAADEQVETAKPRRRGWLVAGIGALATVVALVAVLAEVHGLAAARPSTATAAAPSSSAAAGTAAAMPEARPVLIKAELSDPAVTGGWALAPLIVGTRPVQGGTAPARVPHFETCQADAATLQYLPVQIRGPENWLSATFEVQPTASTPSGIGRLGFFFQAGRDSTPCPDGTWSNSDSFVASNMGQALITGYVVLDQAFTPATPEGRPDVFRTLQLRVSDIRFSGRPVTVGPPSAGSLCPGSASDLCAALG
jgi:hypothetical protein